MQLTTLEGLTLDSNSNQRQEQPPYFTSLEELFASLQILKKLK